MEIPPFLLCECGFGSQCSPDSLMCGPSSGSSTSIRSCYRSPSQTANIRSVTILSIFAMMGVSNVSRRLSGSVICVAPSLHCNSGTYGSETETDQWLKPSSAPLVGNNNSSIDDAKKLVVS